MSTSITTKPSLYTPASSISPSLHVHQIRDPPEQYGLPKVRLSDNRASIRFENP